MTGPMGQMRASGCDVPNGAAAAYVGPDGTFTCRCLICARCGHHTGNSTQGHYWGLCGVTGRIEDFHFCCPGDCELHPPVPAAA